MHHGTIYILCPQSQDSDQRGVTDAAEQRLEFRAYFAMLDQTMSNLDLFENHAEWEAGNPALWSIPMPMVIAVEPVSYAANGYPWSQWTCNFIWQMVVQEGSNDISANLRRRAYYCSVQTKEDYQVWLSALKSACSRNCSWLTRHHPGIYLATSSGDPPSCWTCCQQDHEAQSGCSLTNIVGLETDGVLHRNQAKLDPVVVYRGFKVTVKSSSLSQYGAKTATFKAGESFYVLDINPSASDENLWLVIQEENSDIRRLLPRGLFELCDIRRENWFCQEIPHDIASMLLQTQPAGSFLVRSYKQRLMVSYVSNDLIEHRWIHQNESNSYYLEEAKVFNTLQELVHHYSVLNRQNKNPLFRFCVPHQNLQKIWAVDLSELESNNDAHAQLVASIGSGCQFNTVSCIFSEKRLASLICSAAEETSQSSSVRSREQLWNEARILMCLEHENLCKLVGIVLTPTSSPNGAAAVKANALVVEHYLQPRENLSEFVKIEKEALLAEPNALFQITYQVCTGMAYLQRKGIIHNALALENCFLAAANNDQIKVRIGGFHHAQFEDQVTDNEPDLHQSYTSILALPPPELVHRRAPPSSRSDVWSFGVLLWKLFTFGGGQNARSVSVNKILRHNWNSELPQEVAQFIEKVIRMCLVDVPDLRISFQDLWRIFKNAISQTQLDKENYEQHFNGAQQSSSGSDIFNGLVSGGSTKNSKRKKQRSRTRAPSNGTFDPTAPKYRSPFTPALPLLNGLVLGDEDQCLPTQDCDQPWNDAVTNGSRPQGANTDSEAYSIGDQVSGSSSEPRNAAGSTTKSLRFQLMKEKHEKRKICNELKHCKAKCIEYIDQLREQYQTKIESLEMQLAESETIRKQLLKEKGSLQEKVRFAEGKSNQTNAIVSDMQRQVHQLATNNSALTQAIEELKAENKALSDRVNKSDRAMSEMQSKLIEKQRFADSIEQKLRYYDNKYGSSAISSGNSSANDDPLVINMPNGGNYAPQSAGSNGSSLIRGSMTSDSGISTNSSIGAPKRSIMMNYAQNGAQGKTAIVKMQQQQQHTPNRLGYRQTHNVRQVGLIAPSPPHAVATPSLSQQSLLSLYAQSPTATPLPAAPKPIRSTDVHRSMQELNGQPYAPVSKTPGFNAGSTNLVNTSSGSVQGLVQRDSSTPRPSEAFGALGQTQTSAGFAVV